MRIYRDILEPCLLILESLQNNKYTQSDVAKQRTVNYKIEIARLRIRRRISRGRNRVSQGAAPWWNTGHLRRQISGIIMSRGAMHLCK